MSDRASELAQQLLDKTESGKLEWFPSDDQQFEAFRADIGDGFSFYIQRSTSGSDDKFISFELKKNGYIVFTDQVDNVIRSPKAELMAESLDARIMKFRLFSDLFHAARKSAMGGDQTIKEVRELIERLGKAS
jgi:hypothetical protein